MINVLQPYTEYKESGIPWLGKLPEHWNVTRFKNISWIKSKCGRPELNLLSVYLNRGVIAFSDVDEKRTNATAEKLDAYQVVEPGDLVLNNQQAWRGSVGVAFQQGIVSPAYIILGLRSDINSQFANSLFRCRDMVSSYLVCSKGVGTIQRNLHWPMLKDAKVWLPPPQEQSAIVRFLAALDRRVNRLVRAKRRLIELLTEQKQAIITHAVTRGINPNAKLKPSGTDWIGGVPDHWEVRRVKQVASILRGKFTHRPRDDSSLYDGPYPFIQTGGVARATKFITRYEQTLNEKGLAVSKLFPTDTLVMTIAANIGDVAILGIDACFPDSVVGFRPGAKVSRDFMYLVFKCMKPVLLREAPVNTQGNLNVERIGGMSVPIPPIAEQGAIVAFVEVGTAEVERAISVARQELNLTREYRTRLVADVVTGKLDVRAAAARLPDDEAETAEPVTLDVEEAAASDDEPELAEVASDE